MSEGPSSYAATEQYIQLIRGKRAQLERVQIDAERQFITCVAREHAAGRVSWTELIRVHRFLREGALPGWYQRWQEELPYSAHELKRMEAIHETEEWSGVGMDVYNDPGRPPKGAYVVYLLCDDTGEPIYVGSTQSFANRLSHHRRDKVWASWRAYRCDNRQHAYEVESRFLRQYKPRLNKQGARSAA